jgi:hypothetical protein
VKYLLPILIILLILLVGGMAFFAGKSGVKVPGVALTTPTASPTATGTATPTPTPTVKPTKTVTGGGILSFPKYQLTVPTDWQNTRESQTADDERIILIKGAYKITILQGGFGGGACLYPGDPDMEGPSGRYEFYKEITSKSGDMFRRSWDGDEMTADGFGICHKSQYGWGSPTGYGSISFITPITKTREMIDEMDAILASLTKI